MGAVALDLTPVVDILIAGPFDRAVLEHVRGQVGDHPQAYATALRCAAKRTSDGRAASFWLTEAARVHESVEDLGGAIALLFRAWEHDPGCERTRERLAGCMARLGARVGLGFVTAGLAEQPRPVPRESGLRPGPLEAPSLMPSVTAVPNRDTLPGLFGRAGLEEVAEEVDVEEGATAPVTEADHQAFEGRTRGPRPSVGPSSDGAAPVPLRRQRRTELPPPPARVALDDPDDDAPVSQIARVGHMPRAGESPRAGDLLRAAAAPTEFPPPTRRSAEPSPPSSSSADPSAPTVPPSAFAPGADTEAPPAASGTTEAPPSDSVGGATEPARSADDAAVSVLFEAFHELHFSSDAKEGARFVCRVIEETFRPAAVLVHLYDINRREYVVAAASGKRADVLLDCSTADDEPLIASALRSGEARLVVDPSSDPRLQRGRWLLVEPKRSVLCAPSTLDGRYLGLVEVSDPAGGVFDEGDRNALTYVAATFARFLSRRGIVLSEPPPPGELLSDVAAAIE